MKFWKDKFTQHGEHILKGDSSVYDLYYVVITASIAGEKICKEDCLANTEVRCQITSIEQISIKSSLMKRWFSPHCGVCLIGHGWTSNLSAQIMLFVQGDKGRVIGKYGCIVRERLSQTQESYAMVTPLRKAASYEPRIAILGIWGDTWLTRKYGIYVAVCGSYGALTGFYVTPSAKWREISKCVSYVAVTRIPSLVLRNTWHYVIIHYSYGELPKFVFTQRCDHGINSALKWKITFKFG